MDQLTEVCSLKEIILTIVNENYYYFYSTDSVFLNGRLTISEAAIIVWLTWWNVLVTQWLTDNLHSSWLNDSELYQTDWLYW